MKKVKKNEFIYDYNRMSLKEMVKEYECSSQTIAKYAKVLELKPKRKETNRYLMILDLNEQEIDRFRMLSYGVSKDWRLNKKTREINTTKNIPHSDNGGSD